MKTYPVAELFNSIQGEGVWTGTQMFFVRLAGCNVGVYENPTVEPGQTIADLPPSCIERPEQLRVIYTKHSVCTTVLVDRFLCDTDYHKWKDMTVEAIFDQCRCDHVCISGGEPFLHDLTNLIDWCRAARKSVHIETSGTLPIKEEGLSGVWITCSPKMGFLPSNAMMVDEWKFVVDSRSRPGDMIDNFLKKVGYNAPVYIQPINGVNALDRMALETALEILRRHPNWRLSAQLHKFLGVR